jgi:peptidoglycan/xylan/chitin deacetylase (PgdA/CDA1 family)
MVRVVVTNGTQTATSGWFPYLQATPIVECTATDAGTQETSTNDGGKVDSGKIDSGKVDSGWVDSGWVDSGNTCGSTWVPFWQETEYAGSWWTEFQVFGGGSLATKVSLEVIGDKTYTLSYAYGKWTSGLDYVPSGATAILHATDATGATAQSVAFHYLVDTAPQTDPCKGTASTSTSCLPLSRGMLSITMDDSYPSQNTLTLPLLNKYGVKATIYNITRQLSVYGDLPNALALANAGNETGSHSVNHPDLTTLSAQDLDDELKNSQSYLLGNVGTPVSSIATPMGSYNATVLAAIKKYYTSHRTVNPGLNYMGSSVWELNSDGGYAAVSPQTICAGLQEAATNHGWRILMFHDFTTASTSNADLLYPIADFESILQCAVATPGLDVVTTTEGADAIRCASP